MKTEGSNIPSIIMNEIKIASTSDIHGNLDFKVPVVDILTISGDICPVHGSHNPTQQLHWVNNKFIPWCYELINSKNVNYIVFIAGNHDFVFQVMAKGKNEAFNVQWPAGVHYLYQQHTEIEGVKFYGTPWTPTFGNWAFMQSEDVLNNYFESIPNDLDILLSHGPAHGLNDTIMQRPEWSYGSDPHVGSKSLREHIKRAMPKKLLVGHIHSGSHAPEKFYPDPMSEKFVESVNVSLVDETYTATYVPYQFTVIKE